MRRRRHWQRQRPEMRGREGRGGWWPVSVCLGLAVGDFPAHPVFAVGVEAPEAIVTSVNSRSRDET